MLSNSHICFRIQMVRGVRMSRKSSLFGANPCVISPGESERAIEGEEVVGLEKKEFEAMIPFMADEEKEHTCLLYTTPHYLIVRYAVLLDCRVRLAAL